ncbi:protein shuttle craft [Condylostylus longicornis]|uniref:protein shuttle craft n=1 Tax=Condylostylus longicornis TaxID=2530218 RepID=UPI00244E0A64|nr:protein shuttle craft [Condylostylus longicornis]XP_055372264.1 protein shuttle craft [Condylostylus longicornis]
MSQYSQSNEQNQAGPSGIPNSYQYTTATSTNSLSGNLTSTSSSSSNNNPILESSVHRFFKDSYYNSRIRGNTGLYDYNNMGTCFPNYDQNNYLPSVPSTSNQNYSFNNPLYYNGISSFNDTANPFFYNSNYNNQGFFDNTFYPSTSGMLQATASEFIPRFNNLNLEDSTNNFTLNSSTNSNAQTISEEAKSIDTKNSTSTHKSSNNQNHNWPKNDKYQRNNTESYNNNRSERSEINSSENFNNYNNRRSQNNQARNQYQKYDNHRHSKRRDNWNRNRVTELNESSHSGNNNSNSHTQNSPRKSNSEHSSPRSTKDSPKRPQLIINPQSPENEKLSQREKLIREIEARRLECLVCVESIKTHQHVWSCLNCYHIFHLNCIIKWASSSKSEDGWRCPACQNILKQIPREYYCFCGKVKNPEYNRNDLAHSCGELCGRKDNCSHPCTLLCHPGPCPPCQALITRQCGCGKTVKSMQCYLKGDIECDLKCEKILNCELHTCEEKCHQGKCPACTHKVDQICFCGKNERQVACTRDTIEKKTYSCGKLCGKDLTCGNHKCKDICHKGDCRPCKMIPELITSCPCGKMAIAKDERKSCLDPIPVCTGICGKTLKCGSPSKPHLCVSKCHVGNCPPCNKQTAVKCRCGHMDQMIKCRQLSTRADDARCKKRCTKKRSCGKHKCNQECCIDIDHICPLPCNYTLTCGKHKCDQPCHRGNCPPCYRSSFDELYCECGKNVIYPPVPCGTKRPACDQPCTRQHPCDHPVQHTCHSALQCPPCFVLTTKWCFGHHEQRKTIPCNQESFTCGMPCGKDLRCGRHKCIKLCHDGPCEAESDICKQSCKTKRYDCGHACMAPCHDGECPDTPCKELIEVQCECGNRKQQRTCQEVVREYRRIATAALASSVAEMQRGNTIELSDIMGPMKPTNNKTLECNDECKVLERNRRLAIGLQIRNPDTSQKLLTRYSDFVKSWAKKDPHLVKTIHDALTDLVQLAKQSQQKSRRHSFPVMNREKRQLVHEMCGMFGVDSEAYDAEPNRNVVATAYRERSWLPAMSIMEVMKREAGQRRVPVPNNNAWGVKK